MKLATHYRTIGYFEAVRRWGSIREAARNLDVAASAINRQILKLEAEIGLKLFERLQEGMRLTPAGEMFARHAITVQQDARRLADDFDALRGLRRGEISIIAVESLNADFLPSMIEYMADHYPGIAIRVRTAGSNTIPAAIIAGDADLGLAFSLAPNPELRRAAVGHFRLGAVMRPDHPLAGATSLTVAACTAHRLILPTPEISIHTLLENQLRRLRGRLDVRAEVSSLELMRKLTVKLNAISFQSRIGLEADIAGGRLVHIPLAGGGTLVTELGAFLRNGRSMPASVEVFMGRLLAEIAAREKEESRA
jgi:DNA-binding transcriptional LysR family regulator